MGKSQIDFLREIVKLQEENPECEIIFFVNNETISEEGSYTKQDIQKVEIDLVYNNGEMFYIGEDDIREEMEYELNVTNSNDEDCIDAEELDTLIDDRLEGETEKAIIVYFCA
jgi:hypothetical protein